MRNTAEIGKGREARLSYRLSDISIVPNRRTRSSKDVDTTWNIDAYSFEIPVISHPVDALSSPEFVIEFGRLGGMGVLNAEGLWGRYEEIEPVMQRVKNAAATSTQAVAELQALHKTPINEALLTQRIAEVRESGVTVAVRVSPQRAREIAPVVIRAGAELLIIQGTLISAEHVAEGGEPLNLKEFIGTLDIPVIVGGVVDYFTALHLMRSGAVGVIVGGGTNTNQETLGMDIPMATAIADAAAARRDYLDETEGRYVHIIADGEIERAGDMAKAIACGADAVMLGRPLAAAAEAPGKGLYWPSTAAHPRFPRGVVENVMKRFEGLDQRPCLETILRGPSTNVHGFQDFVGGLRRSMAKSGYTTLKSFQKVELNVISRMW